MAKTRNHSVRFEEKDFEFICKRENLKTAQMVVTFLLNEYLKLYRVEKKSIFAVEKEIYDAPPLPKSFRDEPKQWQDSGADLQVWRNEINNCESLQELDYIGQRIASSSLSRVEQSVLNTFGKQIGKQKGLI